jgi:hypothetical protein
MPSNPVAEDHGERLRNLEESVGEIKISTALHAQSLAHLVEKIGDGFKAVNDRLDRGTSQFDAHEATIRTQQTEIAGLKVLEHNRASRWSTAKKAVLPLLAAAAGVLATRGGETIWAWITALVGH